MFNYFYMGGPLFMSLITLAGLVMLGWTIKVVLDYFASRPIHKQAVNSIPIAGSLAFIMGILAQAIGLYQAMRAIEAAGDVSPALIYGGFKVSLIAPIYGMMLFVISLILWLAFSFTAREKGKSRES